MIIEFKIPNGTMKINADTFFREAPRTKIRKMLKCFKASEPNPEVVQELKDRLHREIKNWKDKATVQAALYVDQRTKLKELENQYDQMCSPCYAVYTVDKDKLTEAKKAISRCRIRAAASGREAERAKRTMDRYADILEIAEKIVL